MTHVLWLLCTFAVIVVCFMLPKCSFLSTLGSRTLYIYLLHAIVLEIPNLRDAMKSLLAHFGCQLQLFLLALSALATAMVLGSDLTVCLTRHFVQPQWLMSVLLAPVSKGA